MKLGFEEEQKKYNSGSQNARALTETWAAASLFCPACGHSKLSKFENNRPAADLYCTSCGEEFELKSQKRKFGKKVVDGAYESLVSRLVSANNPNFVFLNYDPVELCVSNLFIVPKHFFIPEIIEKRKPLASTARRAGWIGCNILLNNIPDSGRIFIVKNRAPISRESVVTKWKRTSFLKNQSAQSRGWLLEVMKCVEKVGEPKFKLKDVYAFEENLSAIYPNNKNVKAKIRQQLQYLRDSGYINFLERGMYELNSGSS